MPPAWGPDCASIHIGCSTYATYAIYLLCLMGLFYVVSYQRSFAHVPAAAVPVPLPFFSFTGWKGSFYGDQHAYGKQAVRFYTETKTITARWFESDIETASSPNMTIGLK